MTTAYTVKRLIFVAAPVQQLACQLAQVADPTGWQNEWSVPLRQAGDASNTVVGYWCQWVMTDAMRQALDGALASSNVTPPATDAEKHVYALGETLPLLSTAQRIVICDSSDGQWTPDAGLAALGLDVLVSDPSAP